MRPNGGPRYAERLRAIEQAVVPAQGATGVKPAPGPVTTARQSYLGGDRLVPQARRFSYWHEEPGGRGTRRRIWRSGGSNPSGRAISEHAIAAKRRRFCASTANKG